MGVQLIKPGHDWYLLKLVTGTWRGQEAILLAV